jgi:hypothetical protein
MSDELTAWQLEVSTSLGALMQGQKAATEWMKHHDQIHEKLQDKAIERAEQRLDAAQEDVKDKKRDGFHLFPHKFDVEIDLFGWLTKGAILTYAGDMIHRAWTHFK